MSCCGQHRLEHGGGDYPAGNEHYKVPTEPCVFCAEKHVSTAYALANENGYETPNRQAIVGQLVAAGWHLYKDHPELAAKIRELRHDIQRRKPVDESRWVELLLSINSMCDAEAEKILEQQTTDKKEA